DFISEGHFGQHIRRMRILYQERQTALLEAASDELKGLRRIPPCDSGMHLVGWLATGVKDTDVADIAKQYGVYVRPLSWQRMRPSDKQELVLGFAATTSDEIHRGVRSLARAITECIATVRARCCVVCASEQRAQSLRAVLQRGDGFQKSPCISAAHAQFFAIAHRDQIPATSAKAEFLQELQIDNRAAMNAHKLLRIELLFQAADTYANAETLTVEMHGYVIGGGCEARYGLDLLYQMRVARFQGDAFKVGGLPLRTRFFRARRANTSREVFPCPTLKRFFCSA